MNDATRILAGRYEIGDLIGRGGMAEVHVGYDTRLGRTVAIKMLRPDLARDPSFQTRFRREAQAAAGLNHPTIVAVYDTGEDTVTNDSGQTQTVPFIVMEYVEGHTVRDILKGDVAAPIDEAVDIVIGVLTALDYSHHAGLVHRDIKPANVMLTPTGAVKVMDFGIARALADSGQTMTQAQAVVGTAQYLSPEQARGENVDARSDLYSTGCLLFELLTGRPPFIGDSPVSVAYQHVREPAPRPSEFASDVPSALDSVVLKALAKTKEERYGSAREFLADLRAVMSGHGAAVAAGAGAAALGAAAGGAAAATGATEVMTTVPDAGIPPTGATAVMPAGQAPGTSAWASTGADGLVDDGDEIDEDEERRRKIRQWLILGGSALGAILLIVVLFALASGGGEDEPEEITLPNLVGLTESQALTELERLGLEADVEYENSEEVDAERVIRTDPEEGATLAEGDTVLLVVSIGADIAIVPSVRGMTQEDAQIRLEEAGFVVTLIETEHDPDFEEGRATRTDPEEGTEHPVNTEITLFVATGQVELPDLRGRSETEARAILNELKLGIEVIDVETDDHRPGEVINHSPRAGLVPRGSSVRVEVAAERQTVQVPNVIGQSRNAATTNLQNRGLVVDVVEQHSPQPSGRVIEQSPAGGETVPQGTVVTIIVSLGPAPPPSPPPGD